MYQYFNASQWEKMKMVTQILKNFNIIVLPDFFQFLKNFFCFCFIYYSFELMVCIEILKMCIAAELSKIEQDLKEINAKIIKLQKHKAELLERKEKLKELSFQKQTNFISDQNKWTHTGSTS